MAWRFIAYADGEHSIGDHQIGVFSEKLIVVIEG